VTEDSDELIGVTGQRAARIVGVDLRRLAIWERIGLAAPEARQRISGRYVRVYGLSDLVDLCVIRALQDRGMAIPHIRRVVEAHRSSVIPHPLRELRWAVDAGKIYVGFEDGSWVGGKNPRQGVMSETINLEEIRVTARAKAVERPPEDLGHVERRARTMGRKQVFAGTRTPVDAVHHYLRRGYPDAEILEAFPHLTSEDIAAARQLLVS
jgi:uncharacterized protein (DUF433 family)